VIGRSRAPRAALSGAAAVLTALVIAACSAAQPGWTFNPSIGVPTAGAAGSAGASGAPSAAPSAPGSVAPSAVTIPGASATSGASATLSLVAKNVMFDKSDLSVSANAAFTIAFDNQDAGIPHNVAIYTDKSATTNLFRGQTVTGPATQDYAVPALQPGTYYFRCDVHPTVMFGTLTVK
jgi:plastocyanin